MTKQTFKPLMVAFAVALSLAGCRCTDGGTGVTRGEPRLLVESDGVNVEADALDFGTVPMGKKVTAKISITNVGTGPLQIESWQKNGEGPAVLLGADVTEPNPVFGVAYEKVVIARGDTLQLEAFFEPPNDARTSVDHEVKLFFKTSNSTKDSVDFTFRGKAIRGIVADRSQHFSGPAAGSSVCG